MLYEEGKMPRVDLFLSYMINEVNEAERTLILQKLFKELRKY